jgi:hypothetical protein
MKRFLLICFILITAGSLVAQTPTVASLNTTSGLAIKWYSLATGGTLYTGTEALVNGQHYYGSQTVNGVESEARLDVTATVTSCITAPTLTTSAVTSIGNTSATLNGNIGAINGASITTRGFKYSTSSGFDPATTGTNISESGTYGTGTFSLSPSGLTTITTYYVVAFATNSAGTTYGSQVSFTTLRQTQYAYTGGQQTFTVPAEITSITIQVWGAQGGTYTNAGGSGGYATGTIAVSSGQVFYVFVGQQPTNSTGGYNGGGAGFSDVSSMGGGGSSDVRINGNVLNDRIIVAGGGGGATNQSTEIGGFGGGLTGGDGSGAQGYIGDDYCGHGATQTAGGAGSTNYGKSTPGAFGQGGNALLAANSLGGGGGGGWYGGGAGDHGGGGGGSSYIGGVTSGSTTSGQRSGNGRILISY